MQINWVGEEIDDKLSSFAFFSCVHFFCSVLHIDFFPVGDKGERGCERWGGLVERSIKRLNGKYGYKIWQVVSIALLPCDMSYFILIYETQFIVESGWATYRFCSALCMLTWKVLRASSDVVENEFGVHSIRPFFRRRTMKKALINCTDTIRLPASNSYFFNALLDSL